MTDTIVIPLGDSRLGSYKEDGSREWPAVDVNGSELDKRTRHRFPCQRLESGSTPFFVVLPLNWKGAAIEVEQPPVAEAAVEAPAPVVAEAEAPSAETSEEGAPPPTGRRGRGGS